MRCECVSTLLVAVLALVYGTQKEGSKSRDVTIAQGNVRGYKAPGAKYFSFYGIPYAKAPTGHLKFKAPLPAPQWTETLEATNRNILCPQTPMMKKTLIQGKRKLLELEDCLIINVHVPETERDNLPVVVYIHGGAFQLGFGDMMTHEPLLNTGNIIEVNFNYRLGAHGFLCLGTEDVPGNAGMKDQVAALRWVNQNIVKFGGNPEEVTIAGYSAGSAAVELLTLSESARGLFNKAILESGSALSTWAVQLDPIADAMNYARPYLADGADIDALETFYKETSLDILQLDPFIDRTNSTFGFVPCIEKATDESSFLTDSPLNIIKSGKFNRVPLLIGFGNMEGIFRLPYFEDWRERMSKKFSEFLPADLTFKDEKEKEKIAEKIKEFYFRDKTVGMATLINFVDYFTDVLFAFPILRSIQKRLEAENDSIYLYQYSYVDENRQLPYNVYGADHCAQSLAISKNIFVEDDATVSENYADVRELLTGLWSNFIISGNPVPQKTEDFPFGWPQITLETANYIELYGSPEVRRGLLKKRAEFWENIYERYYRTPERPFPHKSNAHSEL